MTDSPPDHCARCGETLPRQPSVFNLRPEWRDYLEEEHDLGWFPMGPIVVCCFECQAELTHLHDSIVDHRTHGNDEQAAELVAEMHEELDGLDHDGIVDYQVV